MNDLKDIKAIHNDNRTRIFKIIKDFEDLFPEEFEKTNIKKCGHCGGTGLKKSTGNYYYCSICGGLGYKGFSKIQGKYVCRSCHTNGCGKCNYKGYVDWVTYIVGGDKPNKEQNTKNKMSWSTT